MTVEKTYRDKFAISQSALKDWKAMTPAKWYKTWYTKELQRPVSAATSVGSYLDSLVFTPKDTDKRFMVATVPLPSKKVQEILDEAFKHVSDLNKNAKLFNESNPDKPKIPFKKHTLEDEDLIKNLCKKHEHYTNKPDQAYNDVLKKGTEYFAFLQTAKGRRIINPEDETLAKELQKILYTDKISKPFFEPSNSCEVIFQQTIFAEFDLSGFESLEFLPTKGAIDIGHFNHKRKEFREVDLKYTESPYPDFYNIIRLFDYPFQHSFYDYLVREWLKKYLDGKYKDYVVMPPLNVVIDGEDKIPYIYQYSPDDLYIKRYGIEGTKIKGWEDIINEIAWHFNSGDWSRPKEHQKNGYLSVNVFNKK